MYNREWKLVSELANGKSKEMFFLKAEQVLNYHNHHFDAPLIRVLRDFKAWESPDSFHPTVGQRYTTCCAGSLGFIDFKSSVICFPHDSKYQFIMKNHSVTPHIVLSFPGKFNSYAILKSTWHDFKECCEIDASLFENTPL